MRNEFGNAAARRLMPSQLRQRVSVTREVSDQPYGCRDFDVEDCNGYRLCFGQDIAT